MLSRLRLSQLIQFRLRQSKVLLGHRVMRRDHPRLHLALLELLLLHQQLIHHLTRGSVLFFLDLVDGVNALVVHVHKGVLVGQPIADKVLELLHFDLDDDFVDGLFWGFLLDLEVYDILVFNLGCVLVHNETVTI